MLKDIIKILEIVNAISAQDCTLEKLLGCARQRPMLSYEMGQSFMQSVKMGLICYSVSGELVYWDEVFPSDYNASERLKEIEVSALGLELLNLAKEKQVLTKEAF